MSKRLPSSTPPFAEIEVGSDGRFSEQINDGVVGKLCRLVDQLGSDMHLNLRSVLETILDMIPGQLVLYCRFDPTRHEVQTHMSRGLDDDLIYNGPLEGCFYYRELAETRRKQFLFNSLKKNDLARSDPFVGRYGFNACLGSAVIQNNLTIGAILVFAKKRLHPSQEQLTAVQIMARLIALIAERQSVEQSLNRRIENGELISLIAANAVASLTNEFIDFCLDRIGRWAQIDGAAILWYDELTCQFYTQIESWPEQIAISPAASRIDQLQAMPIIDEVLRGKMPMISQDSEVLNSPFVTSLFPHRAITLLLLLPVYTARKVVGLCLLPGGLDRQQWHKEDIHALMTVAGVIAHWREARSSLRQLDESQALIYQMVQLSPTAIYHIDLRNRRLIKVNEHMVRYTGYSEKELLTMDADELLTPQSRQVFRQRLFDMVSGRPVPDTVEYQFKTKTGAVEWGLFHVRLLFENGQIAGANVVAHIITEHRKAMEELAEYRKKLEALVLERTAALSETNKKLKNEIITHTQTAKELQKKTDHLKEVNTAMNVLLDKRNEDRLQAQEHIRVNLRQLIEPYLDRLDVSGLNATQQQLLNVVRTNLNEVGGAPVPEMTAKYYIFTPNELQVANLIKKGRSTKDISRLLNLSPRTVESYRNSIRKKLGLQNRKVNLKTYLSSKE